MNHIKNYLSLVKFSHTIFAMPFALIGFFLGVSPHFQWNTHVPAGWPGAAGVVPGWHTTMYPPRYLWLQLLLVVLCMVFARSAAMAFNRYLDRKFDALNPRTAVREIPRGIIAPRHALAFTVVNCVLFIVTAGFINRTCFFLSPVALAVVLGYSYNKRFTP